MTFSTRQARRIRPIAVERARQSKFRKGERVFLRGISWCEVEIFYLQDHKPFKNAILRSVRNGSMFFSDLLEVRKLDEPRSW